MNKFTQDAVYFKKLIQEIKPQTINEKTRNRLLYLKPNQKTNTGQDPAIVFNSLLHKSASISKDRNRSVGFEDTFYL